MKETPQLRRQFRLTALLILGFFLAGVFEFMSRQGAVVGIVCGLVIFIVLMDWDLGTE